MPTQLVLSLYGLADGSYIFTDDEVTVVATFPKRPGAIYILFSYASLRWTQTLLQTIPLKVS